MSPAAAVGLAVLVGMAVGLALPPVARLPAAPTRGTTPRPGAGDGWLLRHRRWWALLGGIGAATFVGGTAGVVAGVLAAGGTWVAAGRAEPPAERQRREATRRELPFVVSLLAAALRSGAGPAAAVDVVARALPGPAADRLATVASRLTLGGDPVEVWSELADDPALAALGRTMVRAQRTGAPVVGVVERLAAELAETARAEVEDRARTVGVKAALPLGLCLLPAFLLVGVVPVVAGLLGSIAW